MRLGDCDEHGMHGIFVGDKGFILLLAGKLDQGGGSEGFVCSKASRKVNLPDRCLRCKAGFLLE